VRLSLGAKQLLIAGAMTLAFGLLLGASAITERQLQAQLGALREQLVPRLELGPRLEGQLERVQRGLQDSVAARDLEMLGKVDEAARRLLDDVDAAGALLRGQAGPLHEALAAYFASARAVSLRLIRGETGEPVVDAMAAMQKEQARAGQLLKQATLFDRHELEDAFAQMARAEDAAKATRFAIIIGCLVLVFGLVLYQGRGTIRAVGELVGGLRRFGEGDFRAPIVIPGQDEFHDLATHANRMADNLRRLGAERDRDDWLKTGRAGLGQALAGELEVGELASVACLFVATYLDAPRAALYVARPGELVLAGAFAGPSDDAGAAARFRSGEGLVGQAAQQRELLVIADPPADYLRVRSGLGEGSPRAIALLPLAVGERVAGVLEVAFFAAISDEDRELLTSIGEPLCVAVEVATARTATRELLAETQRQAKRLAAQEDQLRASNEELEAQQEELRQTNEDLRQQADELERQRKLLVARNAELKSAQGELEAKADELAKVSAYKSQFLANMSHELRTPLNSMLLLSGLLADNEGGNLTAQDVEYCRTIHSAGSDLLGLINQVLDLSKIEAGRQSVETAPVALGAVADGCRRIFEPLAAEKRLALRVELDPAAPTTIVTDARRVDQILRNLVGNAIKFTARGEVVVHIGAPDPALPPRRGDLDPARTVAFSVRDTGPGIAREHQERIFQPFEQVDGAVDRKFGGTGLGLGISRELAILLGGELLLSSELGAGSTFVLHLPQAPGAHATATAATPTPRPPTELADDRGQIGDDEPYLLVIEDDLTFARVLLDEVHAQGHKAVVARSGQEGLSWARRVRPCGIILDVKLPDTDGWAVMEGLRSDPATADVPVHFLSAIDSTARGMAMGAVGYLTKPTTRAELVRMIASLAPSQASSRRVLVITDGGQGTAAEQLAGEDLEVVRVEGEAATLAALADGRFDCVVLDLSRPDRDGAAFLEALEHEAPGQLPSLLVYVERPLSRSEAKGLERYADAVVLKEGASLERLVDEVRLFLRRVHGGGARRGGATDRSIEVKLDGKRILVVDDDMRTVYALSAMLRARGAEVVVGDNGRAALQALEAQAPVDAVLMDIMMPEMDGYEAMRRIRRDPRHARLPIIALTAKVMQGDPEKCVAAGATDYLSKPIDPRRLLERLQHHLAGASAGAR
jgi:signal transduction histidine kinase/DNA-binding response OmpR family regulator